MNDDLTREQRIAGQHDALDLFMFLRWHDPDFVREERRNREQIKRQATEDSENKSARG